MKKILYFILIYFFKSSLAESLYYEVPINLTVVPQCIVQGGGKVWIPDYVQSSSDFNTAGNISLICTKNTSWSIAISGSYPRKMSATGGTVDYELYTDSSYTTILSNGNGNGGSLISGIGTGGYQNIPIYSKIFGGQSLLANTNYVSYLTVILTY
jgi:spore coat protein U-like protein